MKDCTMTLIEHKQRYLHFHQVRYKYDCLKGEAILPPQQQRITEDAKFTCSALGKAFEKQTKTIEDQG